MRKGRIIWVLIAVAAALILAAALRVWRASQLPKLPNGWSSNSVWMTGNRPLLSFRPQGAWVSCSLELGRDADVCKFGDYQGRIFLEHIYSTCDRKPPLTNEKLRLRNEGSIWILRLQDGTLLFQTPCPLRHGADALTHP